MKAKKIIIAIVAILVVLGGTFAGLWFFTGVFDFLKPVNNVFSNQLEKALNLEGAKFSNYSDFLKEYKEMSNKSRKSTLNMTAKLNISELDSDIQKTINKSKITLESNTDVSGKKTQNKIGLYSNNSEVLTLDLVTNDTKMAIGCEDLYDKYISISAEDLAEYIEKNYKGEFDADELEMLSKGLSGTNVDPYELLYISDSDLKHFDETYRDCLKNFISKDCYSSKKDVKVDVDGDDVKTTAYYLTLTGKDAYDFINKLSDTVKNDDTLARLITEKINLIMKSAGQEEIKQSEVSDFIDEMLEELLDKAKDIEDIDDQAIQIAIYSKNSKPVRIEVNTIEDIDDKDEAETILSVEYAKNKDIYTVYQNGESYIVVENEYSKKTDKEKVGKLTAKASGMSIGTLDYEIVMKDNEEKIDLSLNVPLASVSADIELSTKGNYKKEPVDINGLFSFKYGKESAEIKFDGTIEYGDVSVPELTSKNSVDVLKLSEEELKTEAQKILKKASQVLPNRLKLIGITVKAEDIYSEPVSNETTDTATTTEDAA